MKVLLIGYGSIGKRHAEILRGTFKAESLDVVTRQDITGLTTFKTLEDVADLDKYDFHIISSETYRHFEQLKFLEERLRGKKILVEKPLFEVSKDFEISRNRVFVAYNLRFHPAITALRQVLSEQEVLFVNVLAGQYLPAWRPAADYRNSYSASQSKGGGVLLDLSHEIDYVQWLFGKIISVSSINMKISNLEIDSNDVVTAIGFTEKGIIVNFSMDYLSKIPLRRIVVQTNELTIITDLITSELRVGAIGRPDLRHDTFKTERNTTYIGMHEAIMNESSDVCTFAEGQAVMHTIKMIQENRNTRRLHV